MKTIIGVAVKGIIIDSGKALILKRATESKHSALNWEVSGGKLEFGETPLDGLKREIFEETSLEIKAAELLYAEPYYLDEDTEVIVLCYLCELNDNSSRKVVLSNEHSDYRWVGKTDFINSLQTVVVKAFEKHKVFDKIKFT